MSMAQTSQNDSFGLVLLDAATFFYPALSNRCLWPKRVKMTHLDSFGLAMLAAATFFHPALDNRCLWPKRVKMTRLGSLCSPLAPLPPFSYAQDVPCGYRCCPASRCCPVSQLYEVSRCRCVVLASRWSRGHTPVRAWSSLGAMMVVVVVVVTVCIVYLTLAPVTAVQPLRLHLDSRASFVVVVVWWTRRVVDTLRCRVCCCRLIG